MILVIDKTYQPLNVIGRNRALKMLYQGRASMLMEPNIIQIHNYIKRRNTSPKCTKCNVAIRDEYICQYCGRLCGQANRTIDHVIPRSKGGKTSFENCVMACKKCNQKKKDKTLVEAGMSLLRQPKSVSYTNLMATKYGSLFAQFNNWTSSAFMAA